MTIIIHAEVFIESLLQAFKRFNFTLWFFIENFHGKISFTSWHKLTTTVFERFEVFKSQLHSDLLLWFFILLTTLSMSSSSSHQHNKWEKFLCKVFEGWKLKVFKSRLLDDYLSGKILTKKQERRRKINSIVLFTVYITQKKKCLEAIIWL